MQGTIKSCRACGGDFGPVFCDLGQMPLANTYLPPDADLTDERRFPLRAVLCRECRMVQLDYIAPPEQIFRDYAYRSSMSQSWRQHAAQFCHDMMASRGLDAKSLVIEVASNDGYLLQNFTAAGIPCLGIEPAENLAEIARNAGIPTEAEFLTPTLAHALLKQLNRQADLVIANNVLAHVPDINGFVRALSMLTAPDGLLSIEVPYLLSLVDSVQFDTIYHEHYAYWSLVSVEPLLARHGLYVRDVERLKTHGGSIRILATSRPSIPSPRLIALRDEEAKRGLADDVFYSGFNQKIQQVTSGFQQWMRDMKGQRIAGYGAAAKGNTFLNAVGLGAGDLLAVADLAPEKQGRLLPGSHIPITSPEAMLAMAPDEILILPWNLAPEITANLRRAGFEGGIWTAIPEMQRHE